MKSKSHTMYPTNPKSQMNPRSIQNINKQNIHPNRMLPSTQQQSHGDRIENYPKVSCFRVPHSLNTNVNEKDENDGKISINKQDWRKRAMKLSDRQVLLNNKLLQMLCRTSIRNCSPQKYHISDKVVTETGSMVTNSKPSKSHSLLLSNSNSNQNQSNSNSNSHKLGNTLRRYLQHSSKANTNAKLLHPHSCQYYAQHQQHQSQLCGLDEQQLNKMFAVSTELLPSSESHNNNSNNSNSLLKVIQELQSTVHDITGFTNTKNTNDESNPQQTITNIISMLKKYKHNRDSKCPV